MNTSVRNSHKHSTDFASKAIARIHEENLPATPEMFALFYNYYSGENPEVARAIDIMVSHNFELTKERCIELYRRHLDPSKAEEKLEKAQDIVGQTLSSVGDMFDSFKLSNHGISVSMENIQASVTEAISPDELKALLVKVMSEAQKMVSENTQLEKKLEQSSTQMKELKQELEIIREEAFTDSLTGIPNRKKFDLEVVRLVAEARDNKSDISIAFIDIDHFKSFNDAYGHQIGDQVLRLVAKTFKDGLKGQDFVCRYGGEEFVLIMPKTDPSGASHIVNILRDTVKNKEIKNRKTGDSLTRVTFSAGVSSLLKDEEIQDWIDRADNALYQAKRKGRDCVVVSDKHNK